jgi:hypothetical protein
MKIYKLILNIIQIQLGILKTILKENKVEIHTLIYFKIYSKATKNQSVILI